MVNFTELENKVAALLTLVVNIKKDYADMLALIADLQEFDFEAPVQAKIDSLADQLDESIVALGEVEASFPAPVPAPADPTPVV